MIEGPKVAFKFNLCLLDIDPSSGKTACGVLFSVWWTVVLSIFSIRFKGFFHVLLEKALVDRLVSDAF